MFNCRSPNAAYTFVMCKYELLTYSHTYLTLSLPIPLRLYTLPYWSNPPVLIFDIRALCRSVLSAAVAKYQKLELVG